MDLIELREASFTQPLKLNRETSSSIWNALACTGTKLHLDLGGLPKLVLTNTAGDVLRYIPYAMVRDFKLSEDKNITVKPKPAKK